MDIVKLTSAQMKVLSDILNKSTNGEVVSLQDYSKRVINKLVELELIVSENGLPSEIATRVYFNNLKRDTILTNKDGKSICLNKNNGEGWEFIWFMTKGKIGGGIVSYANLVREYKID